LSHNSVAELHALKTVAATARPAATRNGRAKPPRLQRFENR
jgi:hypothetical protein